MSHRLKLIASPEPVKRATGELSSGSRTPSHQSGALVTEIALNQLRINDQVVIRTAHSTYIFLVTDPVKHLGLVVGGLFGDYAAEVFLEVSPGTHDQLLQIGVRVCFFNGSKAGCKRVITSAITGLIHRRAGTDLPR